MTTKTLPYGWKKTLLSVSNAYKAFQGLGWVQSQ